MTKLLGELFRQCWPILAVLAVAGIMYLLLMGWAAAHATRVKKRRDERWRSEQALREREGR